MLIVIRKSFDIKQTLINHFSFPFDIHVGNEQVEHIGAYFAS